MALSTLGLEEIYGLSGGSSHTSSCTSASSSNMVNTQQGKLLSLLDVGRQFSLQPPLMPECSVHWLAVEGVQPVVPENPTPAVLNVANLGGSAAASAVSAASGAAGPDARHTAARNEHVFPSLLSEEMQVRNTRLVVTPCTGALPNFLRQNVCPLKNFFFRCTTILAAAGNVNPADLKFAQSNSGSGSAGSSGSSGADSSAHASNNQAAAAAAVALSMAPIASPASTVAIVCSILQSSPGLQELVPYFVQFFCTKVSAHEYDDHVQRSVEQHPHLLLPFLPCIVQIVQNIDSNINVLHGIIRYVAKL